MTSEKHRLRLMGAFAASAPLSRKARALLAYMALNADAPVTRERLAGLLWSERGEEQARASLRQCLQELRPFASGPAPLIDIGRESLVLHGERAATELDEFRAMARSGDAPGMAAWLDRVAARLLENLDGLDPAFDEWLAVRRAALGNQILAEAMACAQAALPARPAEALRLSQAIMAREPLDEAAARLAMTAAHALGEAGEVSRVWRRLTAALREDAGVDPSAETAACHARCARAAPKPASPETTPAATPAAPASPRRRLRLWLGSAAALLGTGAAAMIWLSFGANSDKPTAIQVDRLRIPAGDAAAALFADGLASDVAQMARARSSTLRVFEADANPIFAGPGFVLGGRARSAGGRIDASIDLYQAGGGAILWSASFDRPLADAPEMRRQAAMKLADVLTCAVHEGDQRAGDVETLKMFLSACEGIGASDMPPQAIRDVLRKVVARAPGFARAWAELALADAFVSWDETDSPERVAVDRRAVDYDASRALALDPRQGHAWVARAVAASPFREWPQRVEYLTRAERLEPDDPVAEYELSNTFGDIGRLADALAAQRRAVDLDPLSVGQSTELAADQAYAGQMGEADATLDAAARRWPDNPSVNDMRIFLNVRVGDPRLGLRLLDAPGSLPRWNPTVRQYWRFLAQARIDPRQSPAAAAFMRAHAGRDLHVHLAIEGLASLGREDDAFDLADREFATVANGTGVTGVLFRPFMARFLASPRFMPLAARVGLTDVWRRTGLWPDFCAAPDAPYDCKARARALAA